MSKGDTTGPDPGVGSLTFESDLSLVRYYLDVIRRRIWIIATVFLVFLAVGTIRAFRAVPVYQATAKVMVETQVPRAMRFEGATDDPPGWDPEYYQTQVELLQSQAVLERVLRQPEIRSYLESPEGQVFDASAFKEIRESLMAVLGAAPGPVPEQWERLRDIIRAKHLEDTRFLMVRAECGSPRVAEMLANAAARAFQQYYVGKKESANEDAFGFLGGEIGSAEKKMNEAAAALQKFREASGNVSFSDAKQDQPVIDRLDRLNQEFTKVQLERIDLEAQRTVVENLMRQSVTGRVDYLETIVSIPFIREDATVNEKMDRRTAAEKLVATLANTYGPDHPQLVAARADVDRLARELDQVLRATVASLGNRLQALQDKEQELRAELDRQRQDALVVARDAFEFSRLQNEVDRHRRIYDALVQRMMELDVSSGFTRTNVEIVEPASAPKSPIRPNRGRMATMAGFLGLFLGVALGLFFEHLDDTVKTPEDLRNKTGIALLGFVPVAEGDKRGEPPAGFGMITLTDPMTSVAEAYRSIRTSLFYSIPAGHAKTMVLTSCGPGEGKTSTSTNLAVAMAVSGKRTLLIDADLHRPSVHRVFGIERTVGLTSVLVGDATLAAAVVEVPSKDGSLRNLHVLTAGPDTPNPSELLGSVAMSGLLKEAATRYDWILVDTPPVFFVSDASVVSALVDGVVLVIRAGLNNRSRLARVREHLEHLNVRIIGAVLNRVVVSRVGRYYSDYYYHGYSRYAKDYHKSYYGVSRRHPARKEQVAAAPSPGASASTGSVQPAPDAPAKSVDGQRPAAEAAPKRAAEDRPGPDTAAAAGVVDRLEDLKASHARFEDRLQQLRKRIRKDGDTT